MSDDDDGDLDDLPLVTGAPVVEPRGEARAVPRHIAHARALIDGAGASRVVAPSAHGAYVALALLIAPIALSAPLLFLAVILAVGLAGVALCIGAFALHGPIVAHAFVLGVGVTLAGFAIALAHAMFVRFRDDEERVHVVVSRQSEPALYALVDRVAAALGARAPDEIVLDGAINAGAIIDGDRTRVVLGLPLVLAFSVRELACVIGHELRHFEQGTARKLTRVASRSMLWPIVGSAILVEVEPEGVVAKLLQLALRAVLFVLFQPLVWLGVHACRAMGRAQEVDADRAGAAVGGSDAMKSSLARASRLMEAAGKGTLDVDEMRATRAADARQCVARWSRRPAIAGDEHPTPRDRLRVLEREAHAGIIDVDAPAEELFAHLDSYRARIVAQLRKGARVPGVVDARRLP